MTRYTTHDQDGFDLPEAARLLGIDGTGTEHYIVAREQTIYALEGDVVVAMDVSSSPVTEYVDHFGNKRGWTALHYDDRGFAEWLLDGLDAAQEASA